jgi:hypothetical protein
MLAEAGDPRRRSGTPFRARDGTLALLLCFSAARSTPQKRRRGTLLVLGDGSKQAPATLHGANSQIFPPAAFPTPHHLRPAAMAEHWDRHRRLPFSSISRPIDQVAGVDALTAPRRKEKECGGAFRSLAMAMASFPLFGLPRPAGRPSPAGRPAFSGRRRVCKLVGGFLLRHSLPHWKGVQNQSGSSGQGSLASYSSPVGTSCHYS